MDNDTIKTGQVNAKALLSRMREWDEGIEADAATIDGILWALAVDDDLRAAFLAQVEEVRRDYAKEREGMYS
jgi:hypothetical protein